MKRTLAILVPSMLFAAQAARADQYDSFPLSAVEPVQAVEAAKPNLCEHRAVRDIARIDRDLAPVKQVFEIATNPTGFALKQVNAHIVHIPAWVGIAMDPKGYVRNKVIGRIREEAKAAVGLRKDCADEIAAEEA
jgi:hypothetical protein